MRKRYLLILASLVALTAVPVAAAFATGGQTQTDRSARIAFTSHHEQTSDLYVMEIGRTQLLNLTRNGELNYFPDWSPDGKRVVFQVQHFDTAQNDPKRNGHNQIYVMDADGSNQANLTNNPVGDYYTPVWSPDGRHIAYVSAEDDNRTIDIYAMDADGSNRVNLTNHVGHNSFPSWSPDGKHIAFASERDGNVDIYVMNADGSSPVRVTSGAGQNTFNNYPSWSPDGKRIAFVSSRDGNADIYVMNTDSSRIAQLTNTPEFEEYSKWSPDGKYILFTASPPDSKTLPSHAIYIMDADGADRTKVAEGFGPA